jgi:hypothetical protein
LSIIPYFFTQRKCCLVKGVDGGYPLSISHDTRYTFIYTTNKYLSYGKRREVSQERAEETKEGCEEIGVLVSKQ